MSPWTTSQTQEDVWKEEWLTSLLTPPLVSYINQAIKTKSSRHIKVSQTTYTGSLPGYNIMLFNSRPVVYIPFSLWITQFDSLAATSCELPSYWGTLTYWYILCSIFLSPAVFSTHSSIPHSSLRGTTDWTRWEQTSDWNDSSEWRHSRRYGHTTDVDDTLDPCEETRHKEYMLTCGDCYCNGVPC